MIFFLIYVSKIIILNALQQCGIKIHTVFLKFKKQNMEVYVMYKMISAFTTKDTMNYCLCHRQVRKIYLPYTKP